MSPNTLEARRKGRVPFGEILQREITRPNINLACVAAKLGRNESSIRGWRDKGLSPEIDWLIAHRDRFSDQLLLDLLTEIGGDRVVVTLVDRAEVPATVKLQMIREAEMDVDRKAMAVREELYASLADDAVDAEEYAKVHGAKIAWQRASDWLCRLLHRRAVQGASR